jgi:secreted PhoX family phosphatase
MRRCRDRMPRAWLLGFALAAVVAAPAMALTFVDFGADREAALRSQAGNLFGGIGNPLTANGPIVQGAAGANSVGLASGLHVSRVLRGDAAGPAASKLGQNADQIAFWPTDDDPKWGFVCIEAGPTTPGVQRVKLTGADRGTVETVLTGTSGCDGIRRTPWGTILATEEDDTSTALEIYKPTSTTGVSYNRDTLALTDTVGTDESGNVVPRPAIGHFAFEGLGIYPDGTLYAGDELGPSGRRNGGALFKFAPQTPATDRTAAEQAKLDNPKFKSLSPFAAGDLYALELGGSNNGQGDQLGTGRWQGPIDAAHASAEGQAKGTGFYRPEDLDIDPIAAAAGQVRVCWTNTGNAGIANYGEVLCLDDRAASGQPTGTRPEVQQFVTGNPELNQPDNIAFQPKTGIVYVIQDTPRVNGTSVPGDVWACLRDGADVDLQSDGCVRVITDKAAGSEPTGLTFDGSGTRAYLNIQHSPDNPNTALNESSFDEMLVIDGFTPDSAIDAR